MSNTLGDIISFQSLRSTVVYSSCKLTSVLASQPSPILLDAHCFITKARGNYSPTAFLKTSALISEKPHISFDNRRTIMLSRRLFILRLYIYFCSRYSSAYIFTILKKQLRCRPLVESLYSPLEFQILCSTMLRVI